MEIPLGGWKLWLTGFASLNKSGLPINHEQSSKTSCTDQMNKYEQISSCPETLREKKQTKKQTKTKR